MRFYVQRTLRLSAVLAVSLLLGASAPAAEHAPLPTFAVSRWVRTVDGWQRATWERPRLAGDPKLHPFVVAAFISLVAVTALAALPARRALPDRRQGDAEG